MSLIITPSPAAARRLTHPRIGGGVSPEGVGLALFVGVAICLAAAAYAVATLTAPLDLDLLYRMAP